MTQSPSTATGSEAAAVSSGRTGTGSTPARLADDTGQGKTTIASGVVQKISGIAARDVSGVYSMGGGVSRAFGAIRERIPGSAGPSATQGVAVEVGERQAAIDIDVVVEYGVSIVDLTQAIRRNVIASVERMTGLEVTEVNIAVDDIYIDSDDDDSPSRVQ